MNTATDALVKKADLEIDFKCNMKSFNFKMASNEIVYETKVVFPPDADNILKYRNKKVS